MNGGIQQILNKKMTRRGFLSYLGFIFIGVVGISSILKNFSELDPHKNVKSSNSKKRTFGSGAYGV